MRTDVNETVTKGARTHIAIVGRRNSGKSTLINTLTGQQTALVSPVPGTTTDPVRHAIELDALGPCMLIDTAGFDDEGDLGAQRVARTARMMEQTDLAILVLSPALEPDDQLKPEREWLDRLNERDIPFLVLINTGLIADRQVVDDPRSSDFFAGADSSAVKNLVDKLASAKFPPALPTDVRDPKVRGLLIEHLLPLRRQAPLQDDLLDGWIRRGDLVLLVMPQDKSAPQGRLILPQSQTIRALVAGGCVTLSVSPEQLPVALESLTRPPDLIIVDSQVLAQIRPLCPPQSRLTTFSILFAAQKGDIRVFAEGSRAIASLRPDDRVLIAESCSHAPKEEDIGRVKIPAMLRKLAGETLEVDVYTGVDFPADLSAYALIIQCGSCMQNRAFVLNRLRLAKEQQVPMTNYGVAIAYLSGILDQVDYLPPYL